VTFPGRAGGSQIKRDGKVVGSSLIGQPFTLPVLDDKGKPKQDADGNALTRPNPRYFQPRPSADSYNPAGTFFSNRGPNQASARDFYAAQLSAYLGLERPYDAELTAAKVPVDAVTTSASGVDPHISPANAAVQANRIAAVRKLPLARVRALIVDHTDDRALGVLGEPGVNVLELNLALDKEHA
jgi:K+-transporting ATPase ATPase C chain